MSIVFTTGKQPMRKCSFSFLEVVHTKVNSKFCGISTKVENFNTVICSQKLTRHVTSKSIYAVGMIFLFHGLECLATFKERLHNLTNSRSRSTKPSGHLLIKQKHLDHE